MPEALRNISLRVDSRTACSMFLEKIGSETDLPALGSAISRVVQLASSDDDSAHNLTNFVLSDVALTQKVLRLSNTVSYRTATGGVPVTTISRAILLLGFETVKLSALAMLLVDRLPNTQHAQSIRAELAQSLYASVLGRELARRSHFQGAEEAAIAALFKNLGRLLVVSHDYELYRDITALVEAGTHTANQASLQVMGCSYDLIAETILQEWQIPESIVRALTPMHGKIAKTPKNRQEWMQQVAAFTAEAAPMIPFMSNSVEAVDTSPLLQHFGMALNMDRNKMTGIFSDALEEIRTLAESMDMAPLPPVLATEPARQEGDLPEELLLFKPASKADTANLRHPSGKPVNAQELLLKGVQKVTEMSHGPSKNNELIQLVLETLYTAMGFRFACVCLKDRKTNQYISRLALGDNSVSRKAAFNFSALKTKDLFHLSMENNADLMIADSASTKIQELLPKWHQLQLPDARSFIILPLVVDKISIGLFYADRNQPAPEGVSAEETSLIKILKGHVLAALKPQ